jgi:tripartite-type tricarboxylate transporter receptor subunit TctC
MKYLSILLAFWVNAALAFPTKPVKIIVAFPPAAAPTSLRAWWARSCGGLGPGVVVENRAGASGTIGTEVAAKSDPDGHTLFMATMGNMTANQHLYPNMASIRCARFAPITKVVDVHFVFMANPTLPAANVAEVIALAKKKPGELAYSSSGPGGAPHLAMELFKRQAKST